MLAYHNDLAIKANILAQLARHRAADELIKGTYWQHGKGCAVGCTVYSNDHAEYETRFGIPRILARLEDQFFEHLPNGSAKEWPERFMGAIRPGADLTMIWPRFALWLLTEEVPQHTKQPKSLAAMAEVAALYREWVVDAKPSAQRWLSAQRTAYATTAAYAAATAAYAAAYAAATAAYAAAYAATAAYAADAADAARAESYERQSDKLIQLLEAT